MTFPQAAGEGVLGKAMSCMLRVWGVQKSHGVQEALGSQAPSLDQGLSKHVVRVHLFTGGSPLLEAGYAITRALAAWAQDHCSLGKPTAPRSR